LFNEQTIFGIFPTGGFVAPNLPNSFLLLFMRMILGVIIMTLLAVKLHAETWQDITQLTKPKSRVVLGQSLVGGLLMFLYLALLYVSIGLIETGIALTLFFTYPVFTALFSWQFLKITPNKFQTIIMGILLLGTCLTIPAQNSSSSLNLVGIIFGITSGICYALYTINAQKSFDSLHPVSFTWISFATTLGLSAISLLIWQGDIIELTSINLWIGGLLSAIATLSGHLMFNYAIKLIGATYAATIGATNPSLTAILAWLTIQETLNSLQIVGIFIVTLSVFLSNLKISQK
jgi:drug/metabolite transporter (DMT)-like permease